MGHVHLGVPDGQGFFGFQKQDSGFIPSRFGFD